MTNISLSSAPRASRPAAGRAGRAGRAAFAAFAAAVAAFAAVSVLSGCGPRDGSKELAAGEEAFGVRNFEKASRLFEKGLERSPGSAETALWLARAKLALGDLAEAKRFAERALSLSDGADAADVADVKTLLAQVAWHLKDYDAAAQSFRDLAMDARLEPEVRAQAWAGLGVVEYSRERSHLARIAFMRALRLNFKDAAARYHLGLLYRDAFGYCEAALEQFQVFVRLEADASPRVQRVKLSFIPELQKRIAAAAAARPGAANRDSAAAASALSRAAAERKKGRNDSARREYEAALKADPLSAPAALGLAECWEKTAPSKKKGGEANPLNRALESYKVACKLAPSRTQTFLSAGALAAKIGHHATAAEIYSRAVASSPASFDALDGLIRELRKQGKAKTAQAYQLYRESIPARKGK